MLVSHFEADCQGLFDYIQSPFDPDQRKIIVRFHLIEIKFSGYDRHRLKYSQHKPRLA